GKTTFIDPQHPYAGLHSFSEEDKDYFFGRDREIRELSQQIDRNSLTVLFGKSGMGKTSLLNAGLSPWIRRNYYLPIYLRIHFDKPDFSPVDQAKKIIEEKLKEVEPGTVPFGNKTLWEYFYGPAGFDDILQPLLIFDQFEEIFRAKEENRPSVDAFVTEVADLVENRVPAAVRERLERNNERLAPVGREPGLRVIFSMREEYLPRLEMFYPYIPGVRFSRYRVTEMRGEDAIKAVLGPAKEFLDDPEVAKEIIKKLPPLRFAEYNPHESADESWKSKRIEPFILSLFCYQVNEKRRRKREKKLTMELVRDMDARNLLHEFYMDNTKNLEHVRTVV
ncbi:MAG: ATP-binding protein, partial [bacterium]|nr:ATP-binding protein [bacterium]